MPQLSETDELIVIDDCSNDRTLEVTKSLLANYPRVISACFSNQQNKGPSYSRNKGLMKAKMDRVMFVDGDDTVSPNLFFELKSIIRRNEKCDYIAAGLKTISTNKDSHYVRIRTRHVTTDQVLKTNETLKKYVPEYHRVPYDRFDFTHCWGRLYSRKILVEHGINFDEDINQAEDILFNFDYLAHSHYLYFSSHAYYHQHISHNARLSAQLGTNSKYLQTMTRTAFRIFNRTSKYCQFQSSRVKKQRMRQFIAQLLSLGLYRTYFVNKPYYNLKRLQTIMTAPQSKYFNYLKYQRNNSILFFLILYTDTLQIYLRLKKFSIPYKM